MYLLTKQELPLVLEALVLDPYKSLKHSSPGVVIQGLSSLSYEWSSYSFACPRSLLSLGYVSICQAFLTFIS